MSQPHDFPFGIMDVVELLHLKIRRQAPGSVYVDCPICGDQRGKMNVNYQKDTWRCNYCGEYGGMLALYGKVQHVSNADAYRDICEALQNGMLAPEYQMPTAVKAEPLKPQCALADIEVIHHTFTQLLSMLTLSKMHREHLRTVRGLSDEQIDKLGYKSTPPFYLCRPLTERLVKQGCTVQGVPGFYIGKDGKWTVRFSTICAGFLIPARGIDGLIHGAQIRLDVPIRDDNDPDKAGTKYIWLSSSGKDMGVSSGSPVHFVGDPHTRVVYVTEGLLKADVAHSLMDRTFAATAGANNTTQLDLLFAYLAQNGTELVVEAEDMDKYCNEMVQKGASKIYALARKHGLECRRLTWNPNHKGIDDWQLFLRRRQNKKEAERMNFKERFIRGLCEFSTIDDEAEAWHESPEESCQLHEHLGLSKDEYALFIESGCKALEQLLLAQQKQQGYRIYQLDTSGGKTRKFAFGGIDALHKAGYEQPPAAEYQLVCDGVLLCSSASDDMQRLQAIYDRYNDELPADHIGRSTAPSDVIELYSTVCRKYFYCDNDGFCPVRFSPMLVKPFPADK